MKKVLIVLPTISGGGTGKVLLNLVNSLDDTKYEITIKSIYDNFEWAKYYKSSVKYSSFYKSSKNRKLNWLKARIYTFSIKKLPPQILYRLFVKENYDVEIAFFRGASIKILSGSTNKKSKKLAWVHSDFTRCTGIFDWFISEKQTINAYKQFDKIICVSEYAKNKFIERMGINKNVIVRYNVNLCNEIIEKSNEKIDEIKNSIKFTICTVGHLGEAKG